jgi:5'-nucleotidase
MKRIAIDMDGVLADVYSQCIKMHWEESGHLITLEDTIGKTEPEAFPNVLTHINSNGFFRTLPLITGCRNYIKSINEKYDLFIVSAAMQFPFSLIEKKLWLSEHFPFITWEQIVFCGSKGIIDADIMIDDHFKNLDYFAGETLLFTQPHNQLANSGKHRRVDTWDEIGEILLS